MRNTFRTQFNVTTDNVAAAMRFRMLLHCRDWIAEIDPDNPTAVDHEAPDDIAAPLIVLVENGTFIEAGT